MRTVNRSGKSQPKMQDINKNTPLLMAAPCAQELRDRYITHRRSIAPTDWQT